MTKMNSAANYDNLMATTHTTTYSLQHHSTTVVEVANYYMRNCSSVRQQHQRPHHLLQHLRHHHRHRVVAVTVGGVQHRRQQQREVVSCIKQMVACRNRRVWVMMMLAMVLGCQIIGTNSHRIFAHSQTLIKVFYITDFTFLVWPRFE